MHLTGITPALGKNSRALVQVAAERASARGVTVSFDINYRSKLWAPEAARRGLETLLPYVDILFCGEGDAQTVFGLSGDAAQLLTALQTLTPARHVVLTQSHRGASTRIAGELVNVAAKDVTVIDRLGAGDAFAAGVLHGYLAGDIRLG